MIAKSHADRAARILAAGTIHEQIDALWEEGLLLDGVIEAEKARMTKARRSNPRAKMHGRTRASIRSWSEAIDRVRRQLDADDDLGLAGTLLSGRNIR